MARNRVFRSQLQVTIAGDDEAPRKIRCTHNHRTEVAAQDCLFERLKDTFKERKSAPRTVARVEGTIMTSFSRMEWYPLAGSE